MASSIVSHLPSQQELDPAEIALDCFEKLKTLLLTVTGTDFVENYADPLTSHQYLMMISDLSEIGYYYLDLSLRSTDINKSDSVDEAT